MPRVIASGEWIPFGDAKTAAGDTGTERNHAIKRISGGAARTRYPTFLVLPEFRLNL